MDEFIQLLPMTVNSPILPWKNDEFIQLLPMNSPILHHEDEAQATSV